MTPVRNLTPPRALMGAALADVFGSLSATGLLPNSGVRRIVERRPGVALYDFVRAGWHVLEPGTTFIDNWHIRVICDHLEAVSRGEITHLIINIPPGMMKSLLVCVFWPAWEWTFAPQRRWLFSAYADKLAIRDSLKTRRLVESDWYQRNWGKLVAFMDDQNQKTRYETTATGYRIALGIMSGTGERADRVVTDDPHNIRKRESELDRESTIDSWDTVHSQRGASQASAFVIVMQRLHENDLTGHSLEQNMGYVHLVIPMEYEKDRVPTGAPSPVKWRDPRRREGELLWPALFPKERVAKMKKTLGMYQTAAQLQQRPVPKGGAIIRTEWWRYWTVLPPVFDEVIDSWDMSFLKSDDASMVVGELWGRLRAEFYLMWEVRAQLEFAESVIMVLDLQTLFKAYFGAKYGTARGGKYVEAKANGPAIISTLRREIPGLIALQTTELAAGDTTARLRAAAPYVQAGNVLIPDPRAIIVAPNKNLEPLTYEWVLAYKAEIESQPKGRFNDRASATAQAILKLQQHVDSMVSMDALHDRTVGAHGDTKALSEAARVSKGRY